MSCTRTMNSRIDDINSTLGTPDDCDSGYGHRHRPVERHRGGGPEQKDGCCGRALVFAMAGDSCGRRRWLLIPVPQVGKFFASIGFRLVCEGQGAAQSFGCAPEISWQKSGPSFPSSTSSPQPNETCRCAAKSLLVRRVRQWSTSSSRTNCRGGLFRLSRCPRNVSRRLAV